MANKPIAMSKLRQVLKLYCLGQFKLQISTVPGLSRNTVKKYIHYFKELRTTWEEVSQLSDKDLDELFCKEPEPFVDDRLTVLHDFLKVQEKRLKQRGVTLLRLWEEYRVQYPQGFKMTAFYRHYRLWKRRVDPTNQFSFQLIHLYSSLQHEQGVCDSGGSVLRRHICASRKFSAKASHHRKSANRYLQVQNETTQ